MASSSVGETNTMFVPYTTGEADSQRRRELLQSKIRSHAATASYRWRFGPSRRRATKRTSPPVLAAQSIESVAALPSLSTITVPRSDGRDDDTSEPEALAALELLVYKVSRDTFFDGFAGVACRSLTECDFLAIGFFLDQISKLSLARSATGVSGIDPCASQPLIVSLNEQVVQRAMGDMPLLNSLVASTLFFMAHEHPSQTLMKAGYRMLQSAIEAIRQSISIDATMQPFNIHASILFLCLAGLLLQDLEAVRTHLSFLRSSTYDFDGGDHHRGRLSQQVRLCHAFFTSEELGKTACTRDDGGSRNNVLLGSVMVTSVVLYVLDVAVNYISKLGTKLQLRGLDEAVMGQAMSSFMACLKKQRCDLSKSVQIEPAFTCNQPFARSSEMTTEGLDPALNVSLLLSLQLQIALNGGASTNYPLQTLGHRLYVVLQSRQNGRSLLKISALQERLYLCIFISGALALRECPRILEWFEKQAVASMTRLGATTAGSIESAIAPFMISPCVTTDAVIQLMDSWAKRASSSNSV